MTQNVKYGSYNILCMKKKFHSEVIAFYNIEMHGQYSFMSTVQNSLSCYIQFWLQQLQFIVMGCIL